MLKKYIYTETEISPEELAAEFCKLGSKDQAIFFNEIYTITQEWKAGISMQMEYLSQENELTAGGRFDS